MLLCTLACMYLSKLVSLLFSDVYPGVELLGHVVVLVSFFFCVRNPTPFSTAAAPIYVPNYSGDDFLFSTSLPTFVVYILFGDSHFDRCEGY